MMFSHHSALSLIEQLKHREISALELLDQTIARAEHVSATINPLAVKLYERARLAATAADKKLARGRGGALCGLPVTIKDSQWLAGVPCANGSLALTDFVPEKSSASVLKLEAAGAVIFAKTTCPEFSLVGITASELYGITGNPWDPSRTPGGSSGGAAASVAAGVGTLSLGGDGGGSIRIPAAFCGVVGFKPSFGVVPRKPGFKNWQSLVAYGPIARNVADARLMFETVCDGSIEPPLEVFTTLAPPATGDLTGLKLVVSEDLGSAPVDDAVRRVFKSTLDNLEKAGAELIFDHPQLPSSVQTWAVTASYDIWQLEQSEPPRQDRLGELTRSILDFGSQFSAEDFNAAQTQRDVIRDAYADMFQRTGARFLLTPALGCEAFAHGRIHPHVIGDTVIELPWLDWAGFLYDSNLTGMPACVIPMGVGDANMPLSLQIMGPHGSDLNVLNVAERVEARIGWHHPHLNGTTLTN